MIAHEEALPAGYDTAGVLAFLRLRAVPGCEEATAHGLRRALALPRGPGLADLDVRDGRLRIVLELEDAGDEAAAVAACRRLLALDVPAAQAAAALGRDPDLAPLVRAAPGRRLPGCATGAELAVRAVLGQQVTVAAARTLAGRLVARHGGAAPGGLRTFPGPRTLLDAMAPDEPAMPGARRAALRAVLEATATGSLDLEPGGDPAAARAALVALKGIGPWTAEYVVARALAEPDAWPPRDVGLRHALARLGLEEPAAARWSPWRSFAVAHLWASL